MRACRAGGSASDDADLLVFALEILPTLGWRWSSRFRRLLSMLAAITLGLVLAMLRARVCTLCRCPCSISAAALDGAEIKVQSLAELLPC